MSVQIPPITVEITNMIGNLKNFAMYLTKDSEVSADLVQDTLVKALTNQSKFSEGTNLKAWLFTIMKNTFITNSQRLSKRKTVVDNTDNAYYINSGNFSIINHAYSNFLSDDIQDALNKIKDVYAEPFIMYYQGYKYHEISKSLGTPIGTVKNRIHIARKTLQSCLNVHQHR